ncbi:MAG: hypothetical protein HY716_10535 [Planctomycetes bacterium]|nr:hypothetical protein [Planctomycetota bacterium]
MPAEHRFLDILRALNRARVRYLVAGGMAVNLHGVARTTHDLDLYVDLEAANLRRAVKKLGKLGLKPMLPVSAESVADAAIRSRWIREKNMMFFPMLDPDDPLHPVDIFVAHPIPFAKAWARRKRVTADRVPVPLIAVEDLIRLKRKANRLQDRADIENLKRLRHEEQS